MCLVQSQESSNDVPFRREESLSSLSLSDTAATTSTQEYKNKRENENGKRVDGGLKERGNENKARRMKNVVCVCCEGLYATVDF